MNVLVLLLTGCTWISDLDIEKARSRADDDGDGHSKAEDCDDSNPNIYPNAEDAWYDGIDTDCLNNNDFDADEDGYVADQYIGFVTNGDPSTGLLPGGDCDDADPMSYPFADDVWYDGIDSDCNGRNDYDQDNDGYEVTSFVALNADGEEETFEHTGDDCDDLQAEIHPNALDTWYDGIDTDCLLNNDYDADGDGHTPPSYESDLPDDDCNDSNPDIYPQESEVWYDGIDSNCGGDNDYDQDGDGYEAYSYTVLNEDGAEETIVHGGDDCDDYEVSSYVGAVEILSNGLGSPDTIDRDCDGSATSFVLTSVDWLQFDILDDQPSFVHTLQSSENSSNLFVAMMSESSTGTSASNPLAIGFDLETLEPVTYFSWATIPYGYTQGMSIQVTEEFFFGVFGEINATETTVLDRWLHITARNLTSGTITHRRSFVGGNAPEFEDIDIFLDDSSGVERVNAIGCESSDDDDGGLGFNLQYAMNPASSFFSSTGLLLEDKQDSPELSQCKLYGEAGAGKLIGQADSEIIIYDFSYGDGTATPTFTQNSTIPGTPKQILLLDKSEEMPLLLFDDSDDDGIGDITLWTFSDTAGVPVTGTETTIATEVEADSIHAFLRDSTLVIGFADADGVPVVLYGEPGEDLASYYATVDFTATEVLPYLSDDEQRVMVIAIGGSSLDAGGEIIPDDLAFGYASLY
jgi:hypothetical protein